MTGGGTLRIFEIFIGGTAFALIVAAIILYIGIELADRQRVRDRQEEMEMRRRIHGVVVP